MMYSVSDIKKQVRRELALGRLEELKVFLPRGHFDLRNGFCSSSYLNPHALLQEPYQVWQLAQDLLEQIPSTVLDRVDVVAGSETGGALLAFVLAPLVDGQREPGANRVLFAPFHERGGAPSLREHYRKLVAGKNILLVDDVRNTGKTQFLCAALIAGARATLIATAELFDRKSLRFPIPPVDGADIPNYFLTEYPLDRDLVAADRCPQCRLKIPFSRF